MGPKALNLHWFSLWHPVSNWLEPPGHLVISFSNAHLLPLFFRLFTHLHLLIDGSIEDQYITLMIYKRRLCMNIYLLLKELFHISYFAYFSLFIHFSYIFSKKTLWWNSVYSQAYYLVIIRVDNLFWLAEAHSSSSVCYTALLAWYTNWGFFIFYWFGLVLWLIDHCKILMPNLFYKYTFLFLKIQFIMSIVFWCLVLFCFPTLKCLKFYFKQFGLA